MKTKKSLSACDGILLKIAALAINPSQSIILTEAKRCEGIKSSSFVNKIQLISACSNSSIWKNIRKLRKNQLLENSNIIKLTSAGNLLLGEKNGK